MKWVGLKNQLLLKWIKLLHSGLLIIILFPRKLRACACDGDYDSDLINNNFKHIRPMEKEIILIAHPGIIELNITYLKEFCVQGYLLIFLLK